MSTTPIDRSHAAYLQAKKAYDEGFEDRLLDYLIDAAGEALYQADLHRTLSETELEDWLVAWIQKDLAKGCLAPFRFGEVVTPERLKEVVLARGKSYAPTHLCEDCKGPLGYQFRGEKVLWDGDCACRRAAPQVRRWSDPAGMLNITNSRAEAEAIAKAFGFTIGEPL
jgi:hypothetical protein